ncbi:MAG TPA: type I DNA topoisomerase [Polyangiaceae bacterium]|jgi:DNA topoisomerase-1|nr:type I DNA topoisomerase [Polyangiaceae bacterium]
MSKTLVVVESPAKAKTIKKYLGAGYEVMASKGHVRDLPKKLGIDVAHDFQETFEVIESKEKVLEELKTAVKKADSLILATDPDREGEAIAWHIADELGRPGLKVSRVEFHEITKRGVDQGVSHPRALDDHLYDAQRARRVLDRLVGYDVSALVWSKLAFGLSAGRVQSVALRLIVEREREIEAFVPEEYWNIGASLIGKAKHAFFARLVKADGEKVEVGSGEHAAAIRQDLESAAFRVADVTRREQKRNAPAPYTTSKLQQDGTSHLRFTTKRTMNVAQKLYEGVDLKKDGGQVGLITYMRTDSTRVSLDAINEVRTHIESTYGKKHLPEKPNVFRAKKGAQDAHEAIRPTSIEYSPEHVRKYLSDEQFKLYKLIWDRFVASQMSPAVYDQTGVDIEATPARKAPKYKTLGLRANGKVLKFGGWLDQYQRNKDADAQTEFAGEDDDAGGEGGAGENGNGAAAHAPATNGNGAKPKASFDDDTEGTLPEIAAKEVVTLSPPGVVTEQKFTQPPPRFNEGSLVRELEKRGIGRPSTYADIISKVQARDYVERLPGGQMKASDLGKLVVDGLVSTELDFMDPGFTAKMEEDLDLVGAGKLERVALLKRFYTQFTKVLAIAKKGARWAPTPEPTDFTCSDCGSKMLKRWSRNGWFLGCEKYPTCKFTQNLDKEGKEPEKPELTKWNCDKCNKPMMIRTGRYGEFLSCSGYPECKNAKPVPLGVPCPKCGGDIVEVRSKKRGGKAFYGCTKYPTCDFKLWQKPIAEPCPACANPYLIVGGGKKEPKIVCPRGKDCGYSRGLNDPSPHAHGDEADSDARPSLSVRPDSGAAASP